MAEIYGMTSEADIRIKLIDKVALTYLCGGSSMVSWDATTVANIVNIEVVKMFTRKDEW
jgi:hypothetical protein